MCLAVPAKIVSLNAAVDDLFRTGNVDFSGVQKEISLAYVPEATVGDYVIVHVGYALTRLDPEEAEKTLAVMAEAGLMEQAVGA